MASIADVSAAAITAVARQKVKQALAACRTAAQRLAQAQDLDVYAQRVCVDADDIAAVTELLELALTEHQAVHVVVLTSTHT
jgi:hypothetical protein